MLLQRYAFTWYRRWVCLSSSLSATEEAEEEHEDDEEDEESDEEDEEGTTKRKVGIGETCS